jgi:hypothetical protein
VKFVRDVGLSPEVNREEWMRKKQYGDSKSVRERNRNIAIRNIGKVRRYIDEYAASHFF